VPGVAGRAGFGSDHLRQSSKRLITCDISGYGEAGPQSRRMEIDTLRGSVSLPATPVRWDDSDSGELGAIRLRCFYFLEVQGRQGTWRLRFQRRHDYL
jgi:hypothetical protein